MTEKMPIANDTEAELTKLATAYFAQHRMAADDWRYEYIVASGRNTKTSSLIARNGTQSLCWRLVQQGNKAFIEAPPRTNC